MAPPRDKTSQPPVEMAKSPLPMKEAVGGEIKVHLASEEVVELPRGCVLALEPALAHERDPERAH